MFLRLSLIFVFILITIPVSFTACDWFKDLLVKVKDTDKNEFNVTLNGCLDKANFEGRDVDSLFIRSQTIGDLGPDSVKDLDNLRVVSFWGCKINSVSPGAFKNLPKVTTIQLAYGNIKEVPRDTFNLFPTIELLRIHNNEVDIIEDRAFANLISLKKIHMDNNQLEYWNREWFTNSTALEIMDFQENKIRTLPRRAFASLTKLKQIFFDWNEISVIHADAFLGIRNLEYLGLRYNRLTEIREDIFPNELRIRSFLIDANYLNFLPDQVLQKVSVKDLTIDNNPWKCPCLDRINFWVFRTNGTLRTSSFCTGLNIPVCAYPRSFSHTCLEYVDSELTQRFLESVQAIPNIPDVCVRIKKGLH